MCSPENAQTPEIWPISRSQNTAKNEENQQTMTKI